MSSEVRAEDKTPTSPEATRQAETLMKNDPGKFADIATARAEVWRRRPDLAERYQQLPPEAASLAARTEPVVKGAGVIREVEQAAADLRKADPSISPAQAKARVWQEWDDLRDRYNREFGA